MGSSISVVGWCFIDIGAFVGIVAIAALIDWTEYLDKDGWSERLSDQANHAVQNKIGKSQETESSRASNLGIQDEKLKKGLSMFLGESKYCKEFLESLLKQRRFYRKEDRKSNFILFMMNNNPILGMVFATRGHPFSRNFRRMGFIFQQSLAFLFAALIADSKSNSDIDGEGITFVNVFCFTPILIIVGAVYYNCTILSFYMQGDITCLACVGGCFRWLVTGFALFLSAVSLIFYYVAGIVQNSPSDSSSLLTSYLWEILVISNVQEIILTMLSFVDGVYISIPGLTIGQWYLESLQQIQEDLDKAAGKEPEPARGCLGSITDMILYRSKEPEQNLATPKKLFYGLVTYIICADVQAFIDTFLKCVTGAPGKKNSPHSIVPLSPTADMLQT